MGAEDVATKLAVHEAVCAERWKAVHDRLARIEWVMGAGVAILLGEELGIGALLRRWIGLAG